MKGVKKRRISIYLFSLYFGMVLVSFIVALIFASTLKIKDLSPEAFAEDIDLDELGFSDMTVMDLMGVLQKVTSPDELRINKNAPKKADRAALSEFYEGNGISNGGDLLRGRQEVKYFLTDRQLCLLLDDLIEQRQEQFEAVRRLCGEDAISARSVTLYEEEGRQFLRAIVDVNIENIRDKVFHNFGFPTYQICDDLYFCYVFEVDDEGGAFSARRVSCSLYDLEQDMTDKLLNALFTAYYLSGEGWRDTLHYEQICDAVQEFLITSLGNMGRVRIDAAAEKRKDIKKGDILIYINS
jgi:hypothetical protein